MDALSYFALAILFFVVLVLAYGMIAIHDIPYHIAKARNHPHQDAIHAGGWVSLFTLHAIWPFLWLWAYAYHPVHGYAGKPPKDAAKDASDKTPDAPTTAELQKRIAELEAELKQSKSSKSE
jgi:type VI protein secretion system component VasK